MSELLQNTQKKATYSQKRAFIVMSTGGILRCYVFTEGNNLQVLSILFLQSGILHQTFSFSLVLQ